MEQKQSRNGGTITYGPDTRRGSAVAATPRPRGAPTTTALLAREECGQNASL